MGNLHRYARVSSSATGAGLTLAATVALFAYGGLWLDTRFGTRPWCMVALVICGILGGMLHLIRDLAPEAWPLGKLPKRDPEQGGRPPDEPPD